MLLRVTGRVRVVTAAGPDISNIYLLAGPNIYNICLVAVDAVVAVVSGMHHAERRVIINARWASSGQVLAL